MALLNALQSASIRLMGKKPTAFASSSNKFELELMDMAGEVATDIMKSHEWQALKRVHSISGDVAGTTAFPLPSDFDRFLINADFVGEETIGGRWFQQISDINEFTYLTEREMEISWPGAWMIYANQIRFVPAPEDGETYRIPYISRNFVLSGTGTPKATFTADDDTFALSERLLTLGVIWKWRENKKMDYTGDLENFTKAFGEESAKDGGTPIYRSGSSGRWSMGYRW
jgi:hypothetical protein